MEEKDIALDITERLKNAQINLPEPILKSIDLIMEKVPPLLDAYDWCKKCDYLFSLNHNKFTELFKKINQMKEFYDETRTIFNSHKEIFTLLQEMLSTPKTKIDKIKYMYGIKGGADYVASGDFNYGYFLKFDERILDHFSQFLIELINFTQTPPPKDEHSPIVYRLNQLFQDFPARIYRMQFEIIPGVVYHDYPPNLKFLIDEITALKVIAEIFALLSPDGSFGENLKIVFEEFGAIYEENKKNLKKVRLEGFLGTKRGVEEMEIIFRLLRPIKKSMKNWQ